MSNTDTPDSDVHILVVDDEPDVTEIFCHWLDQRYDAAAVSNGHDALDYLDSNPDVDIVFLDRRMPAMGGDEVLAEIRDNGYDCMVAMITAVDPTENIVDMPFDDYITKPANKDDLYTLVEDLRGRQSYSTKLNEYYSLLAKQAALIEEYPEHKLQEMDTYIELQDDIKELRQDIESETDFSTHRDFVSALKDATNDRL